MLLADLVSSCYWTSRATVFAGRNTGGEAGKVKIKLLADTSTPLRKSVGAVSSFNEVR